MKRRIFIAVFIIYLVVLFKITVFRSAFSFSNFMTGGNVNFNLFGDLIMIAKNDIFSFIYLFVGNIIWFVPFGFILPLLGIKKKLTLIFGAALSLVIEVMQLLFDVGFTELDDLILNTVGSGIGIMLFCLFSHFRERMRHK